MSTDIRAALERLIAAHDADAQVPVREWAEGLDMAIAAARAALAAEPVGEPSEYEWKNIGDGRPVQVQRCDKCGVCPSNVDDCGHFGDSRCSYFGIDAMAAPPAPPAPEPGEVGELVEILTQEAAILEARCNKIANGECRTLVCLWRGGYIRGTESPDPSVATCPEIEKAVAKRRAATLLSQLSAPAPVVVPVAVSDALIKAECALSDVAEGEA
jgi:hypothetical protein